MSFLDLIIITYRAFMSIGFFCFTDCKRAFPKFGNSLPMPLELLSESTGSCIYLPKWNPAKISQQLWSHVQDNLVDFVLCHFVICYFALVYEMNLYEMNLYEMNLYWLKIL